MKNNTKLKTLGLIATTLGISLASFASVSAWGPERTTFTMEKPATYPTFNSITNNPTIGDERDFVRVGEINADVTNLKNEIEVVPGRQYLVYMYYHNNASATYNDKAHSYSGVAVNSRLATSFSTVLTPSDKGTITGKVTADNANPGAVWDEAYMTTKTEKVLMHYVAGSAKIYNDWGTNGWVMPSNLFTEEGALLGLNALNGLIPGCEEYHGVVSYVLQAEELGGSIEKSVSKDGNKFNKSANIAPGDEVTFRLAISNTGDVALTNVVIKDTLPDGLTLVPGSVKLRANASTTEDSLSDAIIANGYNLGTLGTGNTVYITYKAKAGTDFDCNGSELKNNATMTYDSDKPSGETKEDTSSVVVKKTDCEDPNPPLDNCKSNPSLPECQEENCKNNPNLPGCEKNCKTNPEMEGCQELPSTGPLEIVMAAVIIAGIGGGGYYLYRTRKTLSKVESTAKGDGVNKLADKTDDKPAEIAKEKTDKKTDK